MPQQSTGDILDRLPPHSIGSEHSVIGSVLIDPSRMDSVGWLKPEDFHVEANATLWACLGEMRDAGEPIDAGLVYARLRKHGKTALAGGMEHIAECAQAVGVTAHAVAYAKIIAQHAKSRRIIAAATEAIDSVYAAGSEPDGILDALETELSGIRTQTDLRKPVTCREAAIEAIDQIDKLMTTGEGAALPTGLYDVDQNFGGLFPGELTILAALPGVGKTSLALQIAAYNAAHGRTVYFVSLEMNPVEMSKRLACSESGVSQHDVRRQRITAEQSRDLVEAFNQQSDNLVFHSAGDVTPAGLRREVRTLLKRGLGLVVVDYLTLLTPSTHKPVRQEEVADMSRELKRIPRDYHIPLLCLAQFNRQMSDDYARPNRRMLRESGAIEQDADAIWFLWKHKPTDTDPWNAWLGVDKNRNGDTGDLKLTWIARRTTFECFTPEGHAEFTMHGGDF